MPNDSASANHDRLVTLQHILERGALLFTVDMFNPSTQRPILQVDCIECCVAVGLESMAGWFA